ncbi:hypothetical protein V3C99_009604 [Haemonchus contortus]
MNPIALIATLCLAYSIAAYRVTCDGKLEYKLFGELQESYRKRLEESLNKKFDNRDLLVNYKVDVVSFYGGTERLYPSVILSRSPQDRRSTFFVYEMADSSSKFRESGAMEFIEALYHCKPKPNAGFPAH